MIPLLGEVPQRIENRYSNSCTHLHRGSIHNSQKVETTQMSLDGWMNKQKVLPVYNEMIFNHKKERSPDTCYNGSELKNILKRLTQESIAWVNLHGTSVTGKSVETESTLVVARSWGWLRRGEELVLTGFGGLQGSGETVPELGTWPSCSIVRTPNATVELYTLKQLILDSVNFTSIFKTIF